MPRDQFEIRIVGIGDLTEQKDVSIKGIERAAQTQGVDLVVVAENAELFGEMKNQKIIGQSQKLSPPDKNEKNEKTVSNKIGEIKTSDGNVIIFYKSTDGKIKKIIVL